MFNSHRYNSTIKRCEWCERLFGIFRAYKRRNSIMDRKKMIGPTLTPNRKKTLHILQKIKKNFQTKNSRLE